MSLPEWPEIGSDEKVISGNKGFVYQINTKIIMVNSGIMEMPNQ
jgi:hypothetical protein